LKILGALATLLAGCTTRKPPAPVLAPDKPGTSVALSYPILMLGTETPATTVVDTELAFTTTSVSSGRSYTTQKIIDSKGGLYEVKSATPIGEVRSAWLDMGTTPYRVFVEMKLRKTVSVDDARSMVLENVRSPRSQLSRPPERLRKAVEMVQSYRTLDQLIAGCDHQSDWLEHVPKYGAGQ
jgi:hypothetical protein